MLLDFFGLDQNILRIWKLRKYRKTRYLPRAGDRILDLPLARKTVATPHLLNSSLLHLLAFDAATQRIHPDSQAIFVRGAKKWLPRMS